MSKLSSAARLPVCLAVALALGLLVQVLLPIPTPTLTNASARPRALVGRGPDPDPAPFPALSISPAVFASGQPSATSVRAAAPSLEANRLTLVGLAIAGPRAVAVIRDGAGASHALKLGEAVAGWRVAQIAADRVVLVRAGAHQTLTLSAASPPAAPAAPTFLPSARAVPTPTFLSPSGGSR